MKIIGVISSAVAEKIGVVAGQQIFQSEGLIRHIEKRHPDCIAFAPLISEIIASPDFVGRNPNEHNSSFEMIKVVNENLQIGIKMDIKHGYYYVATLHTITTSKLMARIASGRLKKV